MAGLAFLEKYKSRFPDTYEHAKKVVENARVTEMPSVDPDVRYGQEIVYREVAIIIRQLILGIGASG